MASSSSTEVDGKGGKSNPDKPTIYDAKNTTSAPVTLPSPVKSAIPGFEALSNPGKPTIYDAKYTTSAPVTFPSPVRSPLVVSLFFVLFSYVIFYYYFMIIIIIKANSFDYKY